MLLGVAGEVAEGAIRLAATAGATEADLIQRARQEGSLGSGLGLPDGFRGVFQRTISKVFCGECLKYVTGSSHILAPRSFASDHLPASPVSQQLAEMLI